MLYTKRQTVLGNHGNLVGLMARFENVIGEQQGELEDATQKKVGGMNAILIPVWKNLCFGIYAELRRTKTSPFKRKPTKKNRGCCETCTFRTKAILSDVAFITPSFIYLPVLKTISAVTIWHSPWRRTIFPGLLN